MCFQWGQSTQTPAVWKEVRSSQERREDALRGATWWRMGLDGGSTLLSGVSLTTVPTSRLLFLLQQHSVHVQFDNRWSLGMWFLINSYLSNSTIWFCAVFCLPGERASDGDLEDFWDLLRGAAGRVRWLVREHQLDRLHHVQHQTLRR